MAFQQGLSGLNNSSKALDVISNNIANASTVGFKGGQAQFSDAFAASLGAGGASAVGIGSQLAGVQQQFSQGGISNSNNPLDIAINGGGFFRLQKSVADSTASYTRNGQFHIDSQGYIVNAQLNNLTGYPITNNVVNRASLVPVQLDTTGVVPRATGTASVNPGIETQLNFDDRDMRSLASASPDTLAVWSSNTSFPPNNLNTFNYSTSVTVYDQKGNDHALSMYFTRQANSTGAAPDKNEWDTHFVLDDKDITRWVTGATAGQAAPIVAAPAAYVAPVLRFAPDGSIVKTGWGAAGSNTDFQFNINATDAAFPAQFSGLFTTTIPINFDKSTLFGSGYDVNKLVQDGYPYGRLSGVTVSPEGVLRGNYSNGQTKDIIQIALADFISPTGLSSLGNNQWAETAASGQALIGDPGAGNRGLLQASAVEDANVDLTQELVNLITQQRNYQANAQSIKTQDQVMQTLVNMR
jgi:flagellar hook protein FlgE